MRKKIANILRRIFFGKNSNFLGKFLKIFLQKESVKDFFLKPRIAIISPSDLTADLYAQIQSGDYWVKYELIKSFGKKEFSVVNKSEYPDIVIHIFGVQDRLPKNSRNIIWIYGNPYKVNKELLSKYDKIFCLSSKLICEIKEMGFNAEFMIGATSKTPVKTSIKYDVVFVGNATAHLPDPRKIVMDVGETKYNFKVWGRGWNGVLPEKYIAGEYFDNQKLSELYASSKISLCDHMKDMREYGLVNVRIFDILASGGFCISDKNPGIGEIFGDAVPQYENPAHLKELIDFYINNFKERQILMERGQRIALQNSWDKKAEQFIRAINEIK